MILVHFYYLICINWLSKYSCLYHLHCKLLECINRIKVISGSKSIHRFKQYNRDYSALSPNWRNNLSWLLGCLSHRECTNVYGYTLDKTYDES